MKKISKLAAIILTVVMILGLIAACSNQTDEPGTATPAPTATPGGGGGGGGTTPATPSEGFDIASASEIRVSVLGTLDTNPRTPTEDILTPIWREKTKVIPETVEYVQTDMGWASFLQMHHLGGTMPMIIAQPGGPIGNPEAESALREFDIVREITWEELVEYMPRTFERLQNEYGVDPRVWYEANLDPITGTLRYIPGAPNPVTTLYANEPEVMIQNSYGEYNWWFRDDILKMVFPNAKTEQEMMDLFVRQGGNLSFADINDIPIYSLDDLYNYLSAVKDLNLSIDGVEVTPGQINFIEAVGSLMWSSFSLPSMFWHDLADRMYDIREGKWNYFAGTSLWKEYIRFFNNAYNSGLIHPEAFIMQGDQRDAKVANGEFAVWHGWLGIDGARARAAERGDEYGFRRLHMFYPDSFKNEYQDASIRVRPMAQTWNGVILTNMVNEEDVPQILNWVDWNYSREAAELRAWGLPEWSTGEGRNRRFLPEFRDLEEWALTGASGSDRRDGIYYGLAKFDNLFTNWYPETFGVGWTWEDFYNPVNVYPMDVSDPATIDIHWEMEKVVRERHFPMFTFYTEMPLGEEATARRAAFVEHEAVFGDMKIDYSFDAEGAQLATVAAIVGSVDDFEANYQSYLDRFILPQAFQDVFAEHGRLWFAFWEVYWDYLIPVEW